MRTIKTILVANRGEIALRVIRAAKEMGINTVAVYSEADKNALHVRAADRAVLIGPPPSSQSYLQAAKIIDVALEAKCDAIHPGYGFLSENASFARAVNNAGLIFIGPTPEAMDLMGGKLSAKQTARRYNVPMVPGTDQAITDIKEAKRIADDIGYPVLVKASAGGGGKGMRVVANAAEFEEQVRMAMSEASSAFGDNAVFLEKYVTGPRHIEIQVLADNYGNTIHLFERECSIQRRHQKLIEEAPSAVLTPELRQKMGASAVAVAKACGYTGAGTVEFLVDENLDYYFLEMNTRLQVEHPVTELITGIDLVKQQILVAQGHKLAFTQGDLTIIGHAIELRLTAEDPSNNFLPETGTIKHYVRPQGPGIRVDDGFEAGMEIPIYYDPMIAKLIVHGATREDAIDRMIRAIDEYVVTGVSTTLSFGKWVMQHPKFISGEFDTAFIANYFNETALANKPDPDEEKIASVMATIAYHSNVAQKPGAQATAEKDQWSNWYINRKEFL